MSQKRPFPFSHLPNELKVKIIRKLSLEDKQTFRLVSCHCKDVVSATLFRREVIWLISDQTYCFLANCDEAYPTIKIAQLTKSNRIISSTRGAGRFLRTAQCLQLHDTEIGSEILRKLVRYVINLTELKFFNSSCPIADALFSRGKNVYSNVTKLTLTQFHIRGREDYMYPKEIGVSANLSLPQLQHLSINWTRCGLAGLPDDNYTMFYFNCLYLIASVGSTLKSLEFARDSLTNNLSLGDQLEAMDVTQFSQQEQFTLTGLQRLNLQKLKISTSSSDTEVQRVANLYRLERALMHSTELQELYVENLFTSENIDQERPNFPTVASICAELRRPVSLTRVILFTSYSENEVMPFSLRVFSECSQLTELTLAFYLEKHLLDERRHRRWLTDIEALPRSLQVLDLSVFLNNLDQERFPQLFASRVRGPLSRAQMEWLAAGNLPKLRRLYLDVLLEMDYLQIQENVDRDLMWFEKLSKLPGLSNRLLWRNGPGVIDSDEYKRYIDLFEKLSKTDSDGKKFTYTIHYDDD